MSNLPRILGGIVATAILATTAWMVLEEGPPRSDQPPASTPPNAYVPYPTPDAGSGVAPSATPGPTPQTPQASLPTNRKALEDEVAQLLSRLDRIGRVADSILAQGTPPDAATPAEQMMQRFDCLDTERTRISERLSALGRQREALVAAEAAATPRRAAKRPDPEADADGTIDNPTGQEARTAEADLPDDADAGALEQQRAALNLKVEALNLALSDLLRQTLELGAPADEMVPENSLRRFEQLSRERSRSLQRLATTNQRLARLNEAAIPLPPPAATAVPTPERPVPTPPATALQTPAPPPSRHGQASVTATAASPAQPEINLRCRAIVQRAQLGEDLTYEERGYLQRGCSGRAARP